MHRVYYPGDPIPKGTTWLDHNQEVYTVEHEGAANDTAFPLVGIDLPVWREALSDSFTGVKRIDPRGCMCTECEVGATKPFDKANYQDRNRLIWDETVNNTGLNLDRIKKIQRKAMGEFMRLVAGH